MSIHGNRDIIEEAKRELDRHRRQIMELAPCKIVLHLPPPEGGADPQVRIEVVSAKLK